MIQMFYLAFSNIPKKHFCLFVSNIYNWQGKYSPFPFQNQSAIVFFAEASRDRVGTPILAANNILFSLRAPGGMPVVWGQAKEHSSVASTPQAQHLYGFQKVSHRHIHGED